MSYHSKIKPYDIFYSKKDNHYFVCVYTQDQDINNLLKNDFYGVIITTNPKYKKLLEEDKNDYNVEIEINNKKAYVCCDKMSRIKNSKNVILKPYELKEKEVDEIKSKFNKFVGEINRQLKIKE